jgi:hypothetical protein
MLSCTLAYDPRYPRASSSRKSCAIIMVPLCPSLEQIGEVGIESAHIGAARSLRTAADEPTSDRVQADTNLLGDSALRHPLFPQLDHLLIASQAILLIGRREVFRRLSTPRFSFWQPSWSLFFEGDYDLVLA